MENKLLTPGEFAKLARTTKRAVLWYDTKGILNPYKVDDRGYRFYLPQQIVDFQVIMLMRKQGFSIGEISQYLLSNRSLKDLFEAKQDHLRRQILNTKSMLNETKEYYKALTNNGTLVEPILKNLPSYKIVYIEKQGPYAEINSYHQEFKSLLAHIPQDSRPTTVFLDDFYNPNAANMYIGITYRRGLKVIPGARVCEKIIPPYTALVHVHYGSGALLSLLWKEIEQYRRKACLDRNLDLGFADVEFYDPGSYKSGEDVDSKKTEMHLLVRS